MAQTETPSDRSLQDVVDEVIARRVRGEEWTDDQIVAKHPDLMPHLEGELRKVRRVEEARRAARAGREGAAQLTTTVQVEGYDILRLINHGGQAMIYLARQRATGNQVALKVLRFGALADERQRARFEREAELLASIDHPNIVSVLDRGTTRDGQLFLVMNYIAGEPLSPEKLAGRASLHERLHLFVTICRAVDEAHRRGIIHRDLKPGNVRLDETGRPHVLDFGLATDRRGDDLREAMTVTGQFLGSFLWASPEQAEGKCDLTPASDVYALGVILHQLATGGRFPPQVFESVKRALDPTGRASRFTISTEVHPALAEIIGRCLARDPVQRYEAAGALADAVDRFLAEPAVHQHRWKRPRVVAAAIVLLMIGGATALSIAWFNKPSPAVHRVNGRPVLHLDPRLNFHWIPAGEFWMGSPLSESERLADERRHLVRIKRGFYMLQTEVPQWLYAQVMGKNPSKHQSDNGELPVESVTWHDAVAFCEAYSKQTGRRVRLPTEAEWEYACRAGSNAKYSFGEERSMMVRYGNFADRSSILPGRTLDLDDGCPVTAQVHTYLTNAWGLVQMHGNVWEWCLEPYGPYPLGDGVTVDRVPPLLPVAPFAAVARGGSWYDDLSSLRCANRCAMESTTRESTLGFRIVCEDMAQP